MKRTLLSIFALLIFFAGAPVKNGYDVGDTIADFKLKNVDGKMVSLADYANAKGFIIIFDCNTCPVSKAYNNRIIALSKKYEKDFPLVAINPNSPSVSSGESYEEMIKYAKKKGYSFPYLYDESQQTARAFGATNTPHVFVVKKSGKDLKVVYIGAIDDNSRDEGGVSKRYVEQAIDELLAGKEVTTTRTKAIGCSVKWKDA